jgi:protein-disulfide isomerase
MRVHALIPVVLLALAACSTSAQPAGEQASTDIVATVGSTLVLLSDVDAVALQQPAERFGSLTLQQALYEARRAALEIIVGDRLIEAEAKAQGIEPALLAEREISAKVVPPTEDDVAAWHKANPVRVGDATLDETRAAIRAFLGQERGADARRRYVDALRAKTKVTTSLEPPRIHVADAGRPARGPKSAPVQIVEFSDFECPYCLRAHATLERVRETYGDRIRLVYRHYPLTNHPNAKPAAEASLCAAEQDKFWPYHDRLFANPKKLSGPELQEHAAQLGLDVGAFRACVESAKYRADVEADVAAANAVGVSGTPAFFINGRRLEGAQPFEAFKEVIDEELARKR